MTLDHLAQPEDVRKLVEEARHLRGLVIGAESRRAEQPVPVMLDRLANALAASVAPGVAARLRELAACFNRGTISKDLCDLADELDG